MSHALTPAPTAPGSTTITVPDAGDNRTASSVVTPITSLTNLLFWVWGVLSGTVAHSISVNGDIGSMSGSDVNSGRDVFASRDVTATRNVNAGSQVNAGSLTTTFAVVAGSAVHSLGTLEVDTTTVLHGAVSIPTASLSAGGSISAAGALSSGGNVTAAGAVIASGRLTGNKTLRTHSAVGAAGQSADARVAELYYFPSAAAGSTIQIVDTGVDDDTVAFYTNEATNDISVKNPGGTPIASIRGASGHQIRVDVTRILGSWLLTNFVTA